ncbi:hypothetical protein JAAARDRAFT_61340 [Jaapia argillacea MUCL 33604]|uniref:Uncharacterized protein n=1 Tax=Jaapia argillacea MUCL 33604 TaxID=933084 RepID=A0A067PEE4_9AGAM|nr:hypothetical protein JAAARDRAFT_61340 [Jaapia argillacea MUCL 33604]
MKSKDKKSARQQAFTPLQRELVFDIDMTDSTPSVRVVEKPGSLTGVGPSSQQQFEHDVPPFATSSATNIFHGYTPVDVVWISDREAMELTDEQRKAIAGWIAVIRGGKDMRKRVNVRQGTKPLSPPL